MSSAPTINLLSPLVGAYHRPPAKQILEHLPSGCPLQLDPEPSNPYDSSAIKVSVDPCLIPSSQYDSLALALAECGKTLDDIFDTPDPNNFHLGYIAATDGKPLRDLQRTNPSYVGNQTILNALYDAMNSNSHLSITLVFSPEGKPLVSISSQETPRP